MDANVAFDYGWRILAVLVLVFLNGFFVAAEFALVKVRDTQLDALIARGHRRARVTRRVVRNLDSSLSACQLGITLASLGLGWVGEPVFAKLLSPLLDWMEVGPHWRHWIAFMVGFTLITFLHITAGEQSPKWLAIQKPLPTALWVAAPLEWFHRASWPFIWLLNYVSQWLLRQVGVATVSEAEHTHSEEELRLLISSSQKQEGVSKLGREIVRNAFDLKRRIARDVMRPRQEITVISTDMDIHQCLELAEKTRYSRFPLCEGGELDRALGVVHIKDLYAARKQAKSARDLTSVARKIIYVPPSARLERLLQLLLERKLHVSLVVDEYGGTMGMVTLENIIEELVGQIQDEFDQEKPLLVKKEENVWEADGLLPLHELEELLGATLPEEGIATVSGWITHRLGGFPKEGDTVTAGAFQLKVLATDGHRVDRLLIWRPPADGGGSGSQTAFLPQSGA